MLEMHNSEISNYQLKSHHINDMIYKMFGVRTDTKSFWTRSRCLLLCVANSFTRYTDPHTASERKRFADKRVTERATDKVYVKRSYMKKKTKTKRAIVKTKMKLPEKFVNSVVGTQDGIRGAHNPLEHRTRVSPSNLYNPKSLQRACKEWPCGTSHPTLCKLKWKKNIRWKKESE